MEIHSLIRQKKDSFEACCTVISRDPASTSHYYGEGKTFTEIFCFLLGILSKPELIGKTVSRLIIIETLALLEDGNNEKMVEIFQYRQQPGGDIFSAYENLNGSVLSICSAKNCFLAVENLLQPKFDYGRILLHIFPVPLALDSIAGNHEISQKAINAGLNAVASQKD